MTGPPSWTAYIWEAKKGNVSARVAYDGGYNNNRRDFRIINVLGILIPSSNNNNNKIHLKRYPLHRIYLIRDPYAFPPSPSHEIVSNQPKQKPMQR